MSPKPQKLAMPLSPLNLLAEVKSPKVMRTGDSPPINNDIIPVLSQFQSRLASRKQTLRTRSILKRKVDSKPIPENWKEAKMTLQL